MANSSQNKESVIKADVFLDITEEICPLTFVKTKLLLEKTDSGRILEVRLNQGEPLENVPRTLREEGHKILSLAPEDEKNEIYRLFIRRR